MAPRFRCPRARGEIIERYQRARRPAGLAGADRRRRCCSASSPASRRRASGRTGSCSPTPSVRREGPTVPHRRRLLRLPLPFLTFVVDWLFASFVIILIVTAVAHYLNGGIRLQVAAPAGHAAGQAPPLGAARPCSPWSRRPATGCQRYELTTSTRGVVDGATYTDVNAQLPALNLLILISLLAAVLLIINIWRRGWRLPVIAVGLWALVAVVAGTVVPGVRAALPGAAGRVRRRSARTSTATSTPPARRYGLDDVDEPGRTPSDPRPTSRARRRTRRRSRTSACSTRRIVDQTFQQLQELAGYYQFRRPRRRPLHASTASSQQVVLVGPRAEPDRHPGNHVGGPPPRLHPRLRRGPRAGQPGRRRRAARTTSTTARATRTAPLADPARGVLRRGARAATPSSHTSATRSPTTTDRPRTLRGQRAA